MCVCLHACVRVCVMEALFFIIVESVIVLNLCECFS